MAKEKEYLDHRLLRKLMQIFLDKAYANVSCQKQDDPESSTNFFEIT